MTKRRWIRERQTYFPRLWPLYLVVVVATLIIDNALPWGLGNVVVSTLVTLAIAHGRFTVWKRRHPLITPEQYFRAQCEKAMWN